MLSRKNCVRFALLALCTLLPALALAHAADIRSFDPAGKLLASDGSDNHNFGRALAFDGQTAAIGAPGWDNDGKSYQGAVYVFTHDSGSWIERVRLTAENGASRDGFGVAVDLDGTTLAAGMFGKDRPAPSVASDAGAVVVYTGAAASWTEQDTLMPDDLVAMNFFGWSVALDGDTLIAGAYNAFTSENEAAYVYSRTGTAWTQADKLIAPGEAADRNFGYEVSLAGDIALVGAPGSHNSAQIPGAVYVFKRDGQNWSPAGSFAPDDGEAGDNFGCAIDFDGQTAVVGACEAYGMPPGPGKAYVFVRQGSSWAQQAKLIPAVDGLPLEVDDVALDGGRIVLGASGAAKVAGEWTGAAFVYERQGTTWAPSQTLYAGDAQTQDAFGLAVALSADSLLVGAPDKNYLNNSKQGAAYAFKFNDGVERPEKVYLPVILNTGNP